MFELDKYDGSLHDSASIPLTQYHPESNVNGMSLLLWGEHCVECAAPACYSSCDLYQARSDLRCRRFLFGAYRNRTFRSLRGYGVEVSFKKWAKLEALASTAIYPTRSILLLERLLGLLAPLGNAVGSRLYRLTGNRNCAEATYTTVQKLALWLNRRGGHRTRPDAFLLEIYNPGADEAKLQLVFSVSQNHMPRDGASIAPTPPVIRTLPLPPGYSRHQFDAPTFASFLDRGMPFKITMLPEADNNAKLVFLTADFVTLQGKPSASESKQVKCVVFDLDNTLWHGTLAEGDDVKLRPGVRQLLEYLDQRGILISIASKNNFQPAWDKVVDQKVSDYFVYPQIDWRPKSHMIREIAKRLNIGLDTFAFIDDNPFEIGEVSAALPEILCIPVERADNLTSDPRFQGSVTEESRQRRRFYRERALRERDEESFAGDYRAFLASCNIVLDIAGYAPDDHERVAELVQRTNQLNFSGRKYSRAELDGIIAEPTLERYVLRCSDRYGSYGTVGFAIVRQSAQGLEVMDLMLSCRVQGKQIEQAFFGHLLSHHNPYHSPSLWINFRTTDRNAPAQAVLNALGFRPCTESSDGNGRGFILRAKEPMNRDIVQVNCDATNHDVGNGGVSLTSRAAGSATGTA